MVYTLTLSVTENAQQLYKAVLAENLETERAKVTVAFSKETTTFTLTARDIHAFRALESAIMKLVFIHAKMQKVVDGTTRDY